MNENRQNLEDKPAVLPLVERIDVSEAWAINTYATCDLKCLYCITGVQGKSVPRRSRKDVPKVLNAELDALPYMDRIIVGTFCDAYPNVEKDLLITQRAMEVLQKRDLGFHLITKNPLVTRDIELFRHKDTKVHISLTSLNDDWLAKYEPGTAPSSERIAALHYMAEQGIEVRVQAAPYIPDVTNLKAIREAIDPSILICSHPLRVEPFMQGNARSLGLDQATVNRRYKEHYDEVGEMPLLQWARPAPVTGEAQHVRDIIGQTKRTDWEPAAPVKNFVDRKDYKKTLKSFMSSQPEAQPPRRFGWSLWKQKFQKMFS